MSERVTPRTATSIVSPIGLHSSSPEHGFNRCFSGSSTEVEVSFTIGFCR
jgi:hypothetical protein